MEPFAAVSPGIAPTGEAQKLPRYREIANHVLELILNGSFQPGDQVPSLRALADRMGVSMGTVKEAYWYLEGRRYLEARQGAGFFVCKRLPVELPLHVHGVDPQILDPTVVSLCRIYGAYQDQGNQDPSISLSMAIPDPAYWPVSILSRCFQESARDYPNAALSYSMTPGLYELRQRIAVFGLGSGVQVGADEIVITNGCHEALVLALLAVCQAGDLVAVESPCYFNLLGMLRMLKLNILEIPCDPQSGMHIETLAFALDNHPVKAVVTIANFANPNGSLMPAQRKAELVALLSARGIPLIEDDIYGELYQTESRPLTCKSFDADGSVILCSSFSKTLSPGLRIGWVIPGKWQADVERLKNMLNIGSSAIVQMAVSRYLGEGHFDRHLKRLRGLIGANMKAMAEQVRQAFPAGTETRLPAGGLVLWVKLPDGSDSQRLYKAALAEGIMVAPGYLFGLGERYRSYLRLNAGIWNDAVKAAVNRVGALAAECYGK